MAIHGNHVFDSFTAKEIKLSRVAKFQWSLDAERIV